jgi:hypothetical protein
MYNINPIVWGEHLWKFMHYLTLAYPDNPSIDEQNKFKKFFNMIGDYLPCEKCRINFDKHLEKYPLSDDILNSRFDLINWLINIHNEVNIMNNKPVFTYEKAIHKLIHEKPNDCIIVNSRTAVIIISIFLIIALIFFMKCLSRD